MRFARTVRRSLATGALTLALLGASLAAPSSALACDTYVNGYYRSDGTYVSGHYRSCANSSIDDNWSTRGNTNPWTGERGTRSPSYGGFDSCPSYSWSC